MMSKKKISVVVPTFQRAHLLGNCLHALSQQQFPSTDFEIIVVSDGRDEQTRRALNNFLPPLPFVQYIELPHNQGPAAARNSGWRAAQGKLVAFTDDDCLPSPGWLSGLWEAFRAVQCPERIAFTGRVDVPIPEEPTDHERNTAHLETADFITANCACTKAALEAVGGFDERFRYAWREDSDLEFRLLEKNVPIHRKVNALVVHPVRKVQWGVSIREQRKTMFDALLFKKFPSLYRQKIRSSPAWHYYIIVGGFFTMVAGVVIKNSLLSIIGGAAYLTFMSRFIRHRLANTSRSPQHVKEMVATSLVIPFLSVYWTWYGSWKYKVLYY